jgi:hypothetical protein
MRILKITQFNKNKARRELNFKNKKYAIHHCSMDLIDTLVRTAVNGS